MGGIVAFEMARQLTAAGLAVPIVFLIDCSVPVPRNAPHPIDDHESLMAFAADLARTAGRESWASFERLRGLDPESIRNGTFDQTTLGREIAVEFGPDRLRRLHDVFRANRLALDGYQPGSYTGRVVLIQAKSSPSKLDDRSTLGWNALVLGGITTHHLPGDHYTIMQRPAAERLAEILASEIERVEKTPGEIPLR
jgi:thioesterase domain-containing protein